MVCLLSCSSSSTHWRSHLSLVFGFIVHLNHIFTTAAFSFKIPKKKSRPFHLMLSENDSKLFVYAAWGRLVVMQKSPNTCHEEQNTFSVFFYFFLCCPLTIHVCAFIFVVSPFPFCYSTSGSQIRIQQQCNCIQQFLEDWGSPTVPALRTSPLTALSVTLLLLICFQALQTGKWFQVKLMFQSSMFSNSFWNRFKNKRVFGFIETIPQLRSWHCTYQTKGPS